MLLFATISHQHLCECKRAMTHNAHYFLTRSFSLFLFSSVESCDIPHSPHTLHTHFSRNQRNYMLNLQRVHFLLQLNSARYLKFSKNFCSEVMLSSVQNKKKNYKSNNWNCRHPFSEFCFGFYCLNLLLFIECCGLGENGDFSEIPTILYFTKFFSNFRWKKLKFQSYHSILHQNYAQCVKYFR